MNRSFSRVVAAGALATGAALSPSSATAGPVAPEVPAQVAVDSGHKVFLVAHAVGVQIYRCNIGAGGWAFLAPRAELRDDRGTLIGRHYAGPTWQARDGSLVTARKVGEVSVDPTAIDWLKLERRTVVGGADGDRLVATTFIQRTATAGGRAPASAECDVDGELVEVPYTADYYFWKAS